MVHLAISWSHFVPKLGFRIIQTEEYPGWAEKSGVKSTPTLVLPGQPPHAGNLPATHLAFYLWKAAAFLA